MDSDDIQHITLFEQMTGAKVEDFVREDDAMCFLVKEGQMGLAIGRKGSNVDKVRKALGRTVIVLEDSDDPEQFMRNMFQPAEIHGLSVDNLSEGRAATVQISRSDRSKAVGPGGAKIRMVRVLAKRHHNIDDINLRTI